MPQPLPSTHDRDRDAALRARRVRAARVAGVWLMAALAEVVLWQWVHSRPFYREFILPVTVVIAIAAIAASWRIMRGRAGDRRGGDRRGSQRREKEARTSD